MTQKQYIESGGIVEDSKSFFLLDGEIIILKDSRVILRAEIYYRIKNQDLKGFKKPDPIIFK